MTRSIGQRLLAVVLAGAFALAGSADVYGLHHCPHHDHRPAPERPPAGPSQPAVGQDRTDASQAPRHGHEDDGPCTCIGSCHASASAPLVPSGPDVEADATVLAPAETAPSDAILPGGPLPYVTPYPTGPPPRT